MPLHISTSLSFQFINQFTITLLTLINLAGFFFGESLEFFLEFFYLSFFTMSE